MPDQRFYFRPPNPGYAEMGAGIARGIESGVTGFLDEKDRIRSRGIEDEEIRRRRELEDLQRQRTEMETDMLLAEMGGGRGPAPRPAGASDLDFGGIGLAGRRPPAGSPAAALTGRVSLGAPEIGPVQKAVNDPDYDRYMNVGEGMGYVETPAWRKRQAEEGATQAVQAQHGRLTSALMGVREDIDPNAASGAATLMTEGDVDYSDLFPTTSRTGSGAGSTGAMDKETTLEFLQEMYLERDEYGEPAGYLMSPQQMNEIADAMMRGEEVDLPTRDDLKYGRVREQAGRWFNIGGSRGPMSFEEYAGQYGMEQTRRRDSATQGQLPPVTEEQVPMLLQLLQGHDRPAWADVLNAAGFDTENDPIVKRVLKTGQ